MLPPTGWRIQHDYAILFNIALSIRYGSNFLILLSQVYVRMYTYRPTCMHTYMYVYVCVCMYVYAYMYVGMYVGRQCATSGRTFFLGGGSLSETFNWAQHRPSARPIIIL